MTDQKLLAWDIEIYKTIPEGESDWKKFRPLGITCAATWASDEPHARAFYAGRDDVVAPEKMVMVGDTLNVGAPPQNRPMTVDEICTMLQYMQHKRDEGFKIVTWNGLQFDFDILAEESKRANTCAHLAWGHIDIMFQFLCQQGYPVGLNYVAQAMLEGAQKTEGMSGAIAPEKWRGNDDDRLKVIEYVQQDAALTLDIANAIDAAGMLTWITKRGQGTPKTIKMEKLLTCREAVNLAKPDTSWMSTPIPREQFYEWLKYVGVTA